jgi:hypothetical protein
MAKHTDWWIHPLKFSEEVNFFGGFHKWQMHHAQKSKTGNYQHFQNAGSIFGTGTYATCHKKSAAAVPVWATLKTHLTLVLRGTDVKPDDARMIGARSMTSQQKVNYYLHFNPWIYFE